MKILRILLLLFSLSVIAETALNAQAEKVVKKVTKKATNKGKNKFKKWWKSQLRSGKDTPLEEMTLKKNVEVIGFDYSWNIENEDYNSHYFNLLSSYVVGEYDVNPSTGAPRYARVSDMIEKHYVLDSLDAWNPGINKLLWVTYYSDYGSTPSESDKIYSDFLGSSNVQKALTDSLKEVIDVYGFSGFVIDFQNIPPSGDNAKNLYRFIKSLSEKTGGLVYYKLPAIDSKGFYNARVLEDLSKEVTKFIITGYGYTQGNKLQSPSPLFIDGKNDVVGSLNFYTETCGLSPDMLVLDLPMYGLAWQTTGVDVFAPFAPRPNETVANIYNFARTDAQHSADSSFASSNNDKLGVTYTFEDTMTIEAKIKFLKASGFAGIALTPLGYYAAGKEEAKPLWKLISKYYGQPPVKLFFPILAFVIFCLMMALPYSMIRYWQARNQVNRQRSYFWWGVVGMIVLLVMMLLALDIIPRNGNGLKIAGVTIIICMFFPFISKYLKTAKQWS